MLYKKKIIDSTLTDISKVVQTQIVYQLCIRLLPHAIYLI